MALRHSPTASSSVPSRLNFRVESLQFNPCFVDRELPVDGSLFLVDAGGPRGDFALQRFDVADPSVLQTLARQTTQLAFRHVEPTAMLRGVNKVDPPHIVAGLVR